MAAYRRVYDSRHLQADCQEQESAPETYVRQSSTGYLYLHLFTSMGVNATGTLGGRRSSAEDARIEAP